MKVLDHLLKAVRDAAVFNLEIQIATACILWAYRDRQGAAAIPALAAELPEPMILGDYTSEKDIEPAIRLRCVKQLIRRNPDSTTTT